MWDSELNNDFSKDKMQIAETFKKYSTILYVRKFKLNYFMILSYLNQNG